MEEMEKQENNSNIEENDSLVSKSYVESEEDKQLAEKFANVKDIENDSEKLMEVINEATDENEEVDEEKVMNLGFTEEEVRKMEEEYPIDWDKVEYDKYYPELPVITQEDINVLVLTKIVDSKKDITSNINIMRDLIKRYTKFGKKDEHDKKALKYAKEMLARLQNLARKEGTKALSEEGVYLQIRTTTYTKLALYISKKMDITLKEAIDSIKTKGYWFAFLETALKDEKTVYNAVKNIAKLHRTQEQYQDIIEDIMNPMKNIYNMSDVLNKAMTLTQQIYGAYRNAIEFAKFYSLTQSEVKRNAFVAKIGPEKYAELEKHVNNFDTDSYFRGNYGTYFFLFDKVNDDMMALDALFYQRRNDELLKRFASELKQYCIEKVAKLCKGENYVTVRESLTEKITKSPNEVSDKEIKKLNDIEIYSHYFNVAAQYLENPEEGVRYFSQTLFNATYTAFFYNALDDLFRFIDKSYNLPDILDEKEIDLENTKTIQIEGKYSTKMIKTKADTIKHSLLLDMAISVNIVNAPLAESNKDVLDKITNKQYIENAPNIESFLRIDRDTVRKLMATNMSSYVGKVLGVWSEFLGYEEYNKDWPLYITTKLSIMKSKKGKNMNLVVSQ